MTILVTGGTKGIGLAIAEYVARPDEQLVLEHRAFNVTYIRRP